MFVRWKRYKLSGPHRRDYRYIPGDVSLSAVLVESVRINGKPRQRVVKHLATMRTGHLDKPGWRTGFWKDVEKNLNVISDRLTPDKRAKIERAIALRVPKATQEEWQAAWAELAKIEQRCSA